MEVIDCKYFGICSGCGFSHSQIPHEKASKISHLKELIKDFQFNEDIHYQNFSLGTRDRLDFTIEDGRLGLWSHSQNEILDIDLCPQLSPALAELFTEFRKIKWPIKKGSFRLRVGPDGLKGAWLDFANLDVKELLTTQTTLRELLAISDVVEIGQKFKTLKVEGNELKLKDPETHAWWSTEYRNKTVPLFSSIGAFTQPSRIANSWILEKIKSWIMPLPSSSILELGCGIGNMTFAMAPLAKSYTALENDAGNLTALAGNLRRYPLENFKTMDADFHRLANFPESDVVLANPARSGLGEGTKNLLIRSKPQNFIYMSCFPESWAKDSAVLIKSGYLLKELWIVNQFPLSKHYEVLSFFRKP